jgi:O-antigen/teichoic acid export membrane protein
VPNPYSASNVGRGLAKFIESRLVTGALSITVALVIVRFMPITDYAVYATLGAVYVFVIEFSSFGIPQVTNRYVPEGRLHASSADFRRFVWRLLALRMALATVVIIPLALLTGPIAKLLHTSHLVDAMWATWALILVAVFTLHVTHTLEALMAQPHVRRGLYIEWLLRFGVTLGLVIAYSNITAAQALSVQVIAALIAGLVMVSRLVLLLREMPRQDAEVRPTESWPEHPRELVKFGWQSYAYTLLLLPSENFSVRMVAAHFLPTVRMAAYGFFQALASAGRRYLPVHVLITTVEPLLIAHYSESRSMDRLNHMANSVLKLNLMVIAPVIAWTAVAGAGFVAFLTGGKYIEYAWVLPVVLLEPVFEANWYLLRTVAGAVGIPDILVGGAAANLVPLAIMLGLLFAGVGNPLWIVLLGMLAMLLTRNAWASLRLRGRGISYRVDWVGMTKIALAAAVAAVAGYDVAELFLTPDSTLHSFAAGAIMLPAYLGLMMAMRPFSAPERELVNKLTGRFRLPF